MRELKITYSLIDELGTVKQIYKDELMAKTHLNNFNNNDEYCNKFKELLLTKYSTKELHDILWGFHNNEINELPIELQKYLHLYFICYWGDSEDAPYIWYSENIGEYFNEWISFTDGIEPAHKDENSEDSMLFWSTHKVITTNKREFLKSKSTKDFSSWLKEFNDTHYNVLSFSFVNDSNDTEKFFFYLIDSNETDKI